MTAPEPSAPPQVLAMRNGWSRQKHVLKHLYHRAERWDLIVPGLPAHLRERALRAGCELIDRIQAGSERHEAMKPACRQILQADHQAYYSPAYLDSVRTAALQQRVLHLGETSARWAHVGDNGVLVISTDGTDGHPPRVVTAYRWKSFTPEQCPPERFIRKTIQRWRDMTSLSRTTAPAIPVQNTKDPADP